MLGSTSPREEGPGSDNDGPRKTNVMEVQASEPAGGVVDSANQKRQTLRVSIGQARLSILVFGTVCILAAMGLLTFLWKGAATAAARADPGSTWMSLVDRGWATITVTVCAAVIRTGISLQAGLVMSMTAAVLLERYSVPFQDAAFLSIIRAVSVQPATMLLTGGRGVLKSSGFLCCFPMVFLAGLVALASTFTSTILLSDFGTITILGENNTSFMLYTNESTEILFDLWRSPPVPYARFAEHADLSRIESPNIDDTGPTLRVPLPLGSAQRGGRSIRESIRAYDGPATVFDNRVVCLAPNLTLSSFNGTWANIHGGFTGGWLSLSGHVTFTSSDLSPPLNSSKPGTPLPFSCMLPVDDPAPNLMSNLSVCAIQYSSYDPESGFPQTSPLLPTSFLPVITDSPYIFLIFNVTTPDKPNDFGRSNLVGLLETNGGGFPIPETSVLQSTRGSWGVARFVGIDALQGVEISVSACASATIGTPYNVSLRSETDGFEPAMGWAGTALTGTGEASGYDTASVRRQLNVAGLPLTPEERGIMRLDVGATDWTRPLLGPVSGSLVILPTDNLFPTFAFSNTSFDSPPQLGDGTATHPTALMAYGRGTDLGHPAHVSLFRDALQATNSPARALQAFLTTLTRQYFYDVQSRFTGGAEGSLVFSATVVAPTRWAGLAGVAAVVGVHFLVALTATVWYVRETRHTALGQSWAAVSQVVSDATVPVLWRADSMRDGEVEDVLREETSGGGRGFGIVRLRNTGRRELVAL